MLAFATDFILASGSPRRTRLLQMLGIRHETIPSNVHEPENPVGPPAAVVKRLAAEKANAVASVRPEALVLGADTVVVLDDFILGKPRSVEEAGAMLLRLGGRSHQVFTGIALCHRSSERTITGYECTTVTFGDLSVAEIDSYIRTGSPLDKAGSYGIQDDYGALFVSAIDGCYYNVVGLPLHRFYMMVKEHFTDLLAY